jgi:hypothetical protein
MTCGHSEDMLDQIKLMEYSNKPCKHGSGIIGPIIGDRRYRVCRHCGHTWYDKAPSSQFKENEEKHRGMEEKAK